MTSKRISQIHFLEAWGEAWGAVLPAKAPADAADIKVAPTVLGRRPAHARKIGDTEEPLRADLRGVNFQGASLGRINLSGANLEGARFDRADLVEADLTDTSLIRATFQLANLRNANLGNAVIQESDFAVAVLRGADFSSAEIKDSKFEDAFLWGAVLKGADIYESLPPTIDLSRVNLRGARLRGNFAWLNLGSDVARDNLSKAYGHKLKTYLPEGMDPPAHWSEAASDEQFKREWQDFKKTLGMT